jgi:hypothetical protein
MSLSLKGNVTLRGTVLELAGTVPGGGRPSTLLRPDDELFYYPCMMNPGTATRIATNEVDRISFAPDLDQACFFTVRMPQWWAGFKCNILWTKEAASAGNVIWQLDYRRTYFADSNLFTAKIATTPQTVAVPAAVGDRGYTQDLGGVITTDPGGFVGDPSIVHCALRRMGANVNDTYAGAISLAVLGVIRDGRWT